MTYRINEAELPTANIIDVDAIPDAPGATLVDPSTPAVLSPAVQSTRFGAASSHEKLCACLVEFNPTNKFSAAAMADTLIAEEMDIELVLATSPNDLKESEVSWLLGCIVAMKTFGIVENL